MQAELREQSSSAVHASRTASTLRERARRSFTLSGSATLLFTFLAPLGTDAVAVPSRMLYWAVVFMSGSLVGLVCMSALRGWGGLSDRRWAEILVGTTLIAIPHSFFVVVASMLMFGREIASPASVAEVALIVWVLTLAMTALHYPYGGVAAAASPEPPTAETAASPSPAADPSPDRRLPPAFAEKLPARLRTATLIALEAEDHYLRVHTSAGSDLILMRLGDAAGLLEGVDGVRTHRSWWVARSSVLATRTENGRLILELEQGLQVPVSRSAKLKLQEAGWLSERARVAPPVACPDVICGAPVSAEAGHRAGGPSPAPQAPAPRRNSAQH